MTKNQMVAEMLKLTEGWNKLPHNELPVMLFMKEFKKALLKEKFSEEEAEKY